jgi:hypothetical protein
MGHEQPNITTGDQTNPDAYDHAPLPWSRATEQFDAAGQNVAPSLATVQADAWPHVAGVGIPGEA